MVTSYVQCWKKSRGVTDNTVEVHWLHLLLSEMCNTVHVPFLPAY